VTTPFSYPHKGLRCPEQEREVGRLRQLRGSSTQGSKMSRTPRARTRLRGSASCENCTQGSRPRGLRIKLGWTLGLATSGGGQQDRRPRGDSSRAHARERRRARNQLDAAPTVEATEALRRPPPPNRSTRRSGRCWRLPRARARAP